MKLMSTTPAHWAAYLASLTTLVVIVARMPTVISVIATATTFALWAWLTHGSRQDAGQQIYTSDPLNTQEIKTARTAVGMRLQKDIHQHLMPATNSLQQMSDVVSDGSRRLLLSFTDLNRKSGQQLTLLNALLTRLKEGHKKNDSLSMEDFVREVDTALDNTSLIAREIQQDVSNAVTAMQFEDSANQIAQYTQVQLQALHTTMDIIRQELLDDTDIIECLDRIDHQLQSQQAVEVRQVVTAVDMRKGEIDLF